MKFCFEQKTFIEETIDASKLAVIGEDFELTWSEFAVKVDHLVAYFSDSGISALKYPVLIYGHKSANMLVAMYAMMKLEIPYIPVDIIYPFERISKLAEIAQCDVVINTTEKPLNLKGTNEITLSESQIKGAFPNSFTSTEDKPTDPLIYILFTSGSTGDPKGVQISTEAVQSFTRWMSSDFGFSQKDVFMNSAVLSFDLSVFEVMTFGALGGTLLLNNKQTTSDPNLLLARIEKYAASVWVSTPSFALIYARIKNETRMNSVHSFLFCGEILPHDLAQKLIHNYPQAKVINTYGPTEATVATTLVEITQTILDKYNPLPVGVSKRESQLLIEDDEIIIVGPNVSKGYLTLEELNSLKFVTIDGQRAFKTGDKGYLEEGMLFFKGRNDDLVKLHGYRIELNEITAVLNDIDDVVHGETIALSRDGVVKKIVSLAKLSKGSNITVEEVKHALSLRLPEYMVPSDIRFIDEIPLTQNGKVDKKVLMEIYLQK